MTDINITITIPTDKVTDFINGFTKAVLKPPQYEHLTDKQFFKQWLQDSINEAYKTGKTLIARETTPPNIDENIVTVT